jgi:hypothetical protein
MPNGLNYTSGGAGYLVSIGTLRLLVSLQLIHQSTLMIAE